MTTTNIHTITQPDTQPITQPDSQSDARSDERTTPRAHRTPPTRDRTLIGLVIVASVISVVAYAYLASEHVTLAYTDSISHLILARRVFDSTSPGLAQLGGVWLPLPHLLALPLVWVDGLYYSGFAGSLISMVSYVVTSALLYKTARTLTGSTLAGVAAAAVFMTNPNVLYLQSTPMTELLLFACLVGMVYGVQRWIQTSRPAYLIGAGVAALLGSLTRYEAWVLLAGLTVVVLWAALRARGYRYAEGSALAFLYVGGLGVGGWLVWNWLIFGNPIQFQGGEYAKPSLWVGEGEVSVGRLGVALRTYLYAVADNLWLPVMVLAAAGLVALLVHGRLSSASLPTLSLLGLFPFFVLALYAGQRPLHVPQVHDGELYNVRFGLIMVLPAALLTGYLVGVLRGRSRLLAAGAVALATAAVGAAGVVSHNQPTLVEPQNALATGHTHASDEVSTFLAKAWRTDPGGKGSLLMESFGNELVLFNGRVPLNTNIYEGSYQKWLPTLHNPAAHRIRWIVMRGAQQPDKVYRTLHGTAVLDKSYRLVFANSDYHVYRERT